MKNFPFLFLVLLSQIPTILLIIENPIFLINAKNPFVLSTDDEFYYVITKGFNLKINKESEHKVTSENSFTGNYLYIFDNSVNNYIYLYDSKNYFYIKYNSFISYVPTTVYAKPQYGSSEMIIVGSIPQYNDEFIIYGYIKDYLLFSKKSQEYRAFLKINNINEKL